MQQFFYDGQIRRFLEQFIRMLSGFQVEGGRDDTGAMTLVTVPIRYGDASKQAQTIIQENSANSVPCAPLMTVYIDTLKYRRNDVQEPYFVDRKYLHQREWNETEQLYEETQGNAFTVERHMPVPYELGLTLDIWTSNTNQKWQIFEQIAPLFNPALEIQSTDNYLDWTSLSAVEIDPNIRYTSRSIDHQDGSEIDIMTMNFTLPIWITMPARVTKEGVIHKIIANIYDDAGDFVEAIDGDDILNGQRVIVTPHGYQVLLLNGELQVLRASNPRIPLNDGLDPIPEQDSDIQWHAVIDEYGKLRNGISRIKLRQPDGTDVEGTVAYHPTNDNLLLFNVNIDTTPGNTLQAVDAVINPLRSGPNHGLAAPTAGQRYLLTEAIGNANDTDQAEGWEGTGGEELIAKANDIIEYNGVFWEVSFDSEGGSPLEYVTNITTMLQYKWKDGEWVKSYEGIYDGGAWAIVL